MLSQGSCVNAELKKYQTQPTFAEVGLSCSVSFDDVAIMSKTSSNDRPDTAVLLICITSSPTFSRPA